MLRWEHADRGFIAPTELVPRAEATYLIVDIGRGVNQPRYSILRREPVDNAPRVPVDAARRVDHQHDHIGVARAAPVV